jgi:hypothetical protein
MSAQASSSTARSGRALRSATRQRAVTEEEPEEPRAPSAHDDEDQDDEEEPRAPSGSAEGTDSDLTPVPTPEPAPAPELTTADLLRVMQQQQERFQETFQQQQDQMQRQQQQFTEALMERQIAAASTKVFKMTDPDKFCGGAIELDAFISHLKRNFASHRSLFPRGDPDKVQYALGHLGTWTSHKNSKQQDNKMMDPVIWSRNMEKASHPCLQDFTLFEAEIRRTYGDKDRRQKSALRACWETKQGSDETVRNYESRIKSIWRDAEWDETSPGAQRMMYDLAWSGLKSWIRKQIEPLQPDGGFKTLDELFDMAVKVEGPRDVTASKQSHQSQQSKKSNTDKPDTSGKDDPKGKKRSFQQSTSASTSKTEGRDKLPPAEWLSKDEYKRRKEHDLCMRCGDAKHKSVDCPKFSRSRYPGGQNNDKRPRTGDIKTEKN